MRWSADIDTKLSPIECNWQRKLFPPKVCKKEVPAQSADSEGKNCTGQGIERTTAQDVFGELVYQEQNIASRANFVQDHSELET